MKTRPISVITRTLTLTALAAGLLAGCGGGGSNVAEAPVAPPTIRGQVADGYLRGATVFWDCNANQQLDASETRTTTGERGRYELATAPSAACQLIAHVGPDTIDEDQPLQTVGLSYTLLAAPGRHEFISPHTTLVAGQLQTGAAKSVEEADALVVKQLGLPASALSIYLPATTDAQRQMHSLAQQVRGLLQQASGKPDEMAKGALTALGERLTVPGVRASALLGLLPYDYRPGCLGCTLAEWFQPNENHRALRAVNSADAADNAALDGVADLINQKGMVRYGTTLVWDQLDDASLQQAAMAINKREGLTRDPAMRARIEKYRQERMALEASAGKAFAEITEYRLGRSIKDFFISDPDAFFNFALEDATIAANVAIDVMVIGTPARKPGRPSAKLLAWRKKNAADLKKIDTFFKNSLFGLKATKCAKAMVDLENASSEELVDSAVSLVAGCGDFLLGGMTEVQRISKSRKTAIDTSRMLLTTGAGVYDGLTEEQLNLAFAKLIVATTDGLIQGVALMAPNAASEKVFAALDLAVQTANAFIAAWELEIASTKKLDEVHKAATDRLVQEVDKARRSYFIAYLSLFSEYFRVVDTAQDPWVSGVTGAADGSGWLLDVQGRQLPAAALPITLDGQACALTSTATATAHQYRCTTAAPGTREVALADAGGPAGLPRNVTLQGSAPGVWTGWDGKKYVASEVTLKDGYVTKTTSNWGPLRLRLASPVDGDNFRLELRAKNDPFLGGTPAYDLGFTLSNDFSSGKVDAAGNETPTRQVSFTMTNGYFPDFFLVNSDVKDSGRISQPSAFDTRSWHHYVLETQGQTVRIYVDGVLKHSQAYIGRVGPLDTFSIGGKNNLQLEVASLKLTSGR
ncbi:hypothetical protein NYO99_13260 [Pelomonas sp. UHG3]|uniref:Uncharacterized protein n=1 Tax=Roseateles hydrophilus TaxID=2975054 RepID=A0ACC6CC41_9BURK|nr:LamG-like jellyroll fold domain-containing protein [Pelomonas sp. UHG3]MCY4745947.1 hypothetical protein [Pelomonas sp. UHG3]